jgi:ubiquinone/menaquinone biosynthesis C-methylase UbiE/uncharacterized protein YbaR (Trm112 family)
MNPQLVELLACPRCGQAGLELAPLQSGAMNGELSEGMLSCACGAAYPVRGGIPRLLPADLSAELESAQKTFSLEWENFRSGERNWGQDMDYRRDLFIRSMGFDPASPNGGGPAELSGKRILDAGCGSGELAIEMARGLGMDVVAMDLAFGVERAQQRKGDAGVSFLQASVLDPPLQERLFDFVYCAGVLVAVPDARAGFRAISRRVKPGGRCLIWMYHPIDARHHPEDHRKLKVYDLIRRRVTSRLPIGVQRGIYSTLVPPYLAKQALSARLGGDPERLTWHEKMQQLVDFFSPLYQHRYTVEQISAWFAEEGFENITPVDQGPYGFAVRGDLGRA